MDEGESEQNEMRSLQEKLESTTRLVFTLSQQLAELKEQVRLKLVLGMTFKGTLSRLKYHILKVWPVASHNCALLSCNRKKKVLKVGTAKK